MILGDEIFSFVAQGYKILSDEKIFRRPRFQILGDEKYILGDEIRIVAQVLDRRGSSDDVLADDMSSPKCLGDEIF